MTQRRRLVRSKNAEPSVSHRVTQHCNSPLLIRCFSRSSLWHIQCPHCEKVPPRVLSHFSSRVSLSHHPACSDFVLHICQQPTILAIYSKPIAILTQFMVFKFFFPRKWVNMISCMCSNLKKSLNFEPIYRQFFYYFCSEYFRLFWSTH